MLGWVAGFFVLALLAALVGFGMAAVAFAAIAKLVFYFAAVLFLVSLVGHFLRRA
jgi:uncharacterized membrane protein YtjA (UPF0391 family)